MIRFKIANPNTQPIFTDWMDEIIGDPVRATAVQQVANLRREHPDAVISVERSSVIPRKKQIFVRFKIVDGETTLYSIPFPIAQKDKQLALMREKYPDAVITPEEREI